ncbi:uncharacterized protein LOC105382899 [Plutella xylostella]|uniref:uncharacterized protein LOC105382899 n=1 Tax=Plutella xylostella TaxID=51655 RepID=UPI0020325D77|nr:uncharacterized protein LOC105382899 [Plutella xylostella]
MSGFRTLKEVGCKLDEDLRNLSSQLFCVKVRETEEDIIAKKLQDLTTFTSKYRLLHAKISASTPQVTDRVLNGANITSDLEETIQKRVLEGAITKGLSQSRAVQNLISSKDSKLSPDLVDRKERILERMRRLRTLDLELHQLDSVLVEKQSEHEAARAQWDALLGELRDRRASATADSEMVEPGPLYDKLRILVDKMECVRGLLGRLVAGRSSNCDWLSEPRALRALPLTRQFNTVASVMQGSHEDE